MSEVLGIIPARWVSPRFSGKPMIQHVYERCLEGRSLDAVIVATDDRRIVQAVGGFGGRAVMTSSDHPNGTCRVAEAAAGQPCRFVINVQGDEPMIEPREIDLVVRTVMERNCSMATVGRWRTKRRWTIQTW